MDPHQLSARQQELRKSAGLHWMHWLIVAGSVVITAIAWHFSQSLLDERTAQRFQREANDVISRVRGRLTHYEDALLAGVSTIQSRGGDITRKQWHDYATRLNLVERYPGISGIGVIRHVDSLGVPALIERMRDEYPAFEIHPRHPFESHLPIVYIEPEVPNAEAIGLDVAFETKRREAALRSMQLRTTQISGPIVLVQDAGQTPGFLFYAPYYDESGSENTERSDSFATTTTDFSGFVYAPLVVKDLIAGVLGSGKRRVTLSIRDEGTVLYDEAQGDVPDESTLSLHRDVPVYGRTWQFTIGPGADIIGAGRSRQPLLVLICGLLIDAMLFTLFWLMARSSRKVLHLAESMTGDLVARTDALSSANDKLESFAHVASHDLKSPLRNVQDIVGFLEEDLEGYLAGSDANADVRDSLDQLRRQARRGSVLVDGILQYSIAGEGGDVQERVDCRAIIEDVLESTELSPERLELQGVFPEFVTYASRLKQVFQNLIDNALKFHPDPDTARIGIRVSESAGFYRFEIQDDGPGIDPRFQQRIFDAFVTLSTRAQVDSSGIGLSVVKKLVESVGGCVSVRSEAGCGSVFTFEWPVYIDATIRNAA